MRRSHHPKLRRTIPMTLNVAVQMDPIERINIRGDSTFALLLEAQARGFALSYYTPDRLALRDGKVSASVQPLAVRDKAGDHFTLGEARHVALDSFDVVLLRQDPPFDLAYITSTHLLERIQPKTLVVNDPGACAQRAGKGFRHRISRSDAADADHPRSRRHQGVSRRARRHRHEAALRQRRRGGVPAGARGSQFRFALRSVRRDVPRAMGGAEIFARGEGGRQAHHPGRWRIRRRHQSRAGAGRSALQHGARRHTQGDRPDRARARNLRPARPRRCASAGFCSSAST